jgi:dienelactone hydrolase
MSHWFFEEDRPEFDPAAAEQAWTRTLEFLRK